MFLKGMKKKKKPNIDRNLLCPILLLFVLLTLSQTSPCLELRDCSTSLLKTLGKEKNAHNEQFLLFPQCFLPFLRPLCRFHQI